tara:strand:- start:676 stop:924 length:249 start_codon:yes stop_codon:yes gene_type:complete
MTNYRHHEKTIFRNIREQHNLTQLAMAEILNITQPAYSHLETGSSWPSFEVIENMMEAFNVPYKRFREYYRERKSRIERSLT